MICLAHDCFLASRVVRTVLLYGIGSIGAARGPMVFDARNEKWPGVTGRDPARNDPARTTQSETTNAARIATSGAETVGVLET